jgi:hypothetical protein
MAPEPRWNVAKVKGQTGGFYPEQNKRIDPFEKWNFGVAQDNNLNRNELSIS